MHLGFLASGFLGLVLIASNCALPPAAVGTPSTGGGGSPSGGGPNGGAPTGGAAGAAGYVGGMAGMPTGGAPGGGGSSGSSCGLQFAPGDPPCEACAETNCCTELSECGPGTDCDQFIICISNYCSNWGDLACMQTTCGQFYNAGMTALSKIGECVCGGKCPECYSSCEGPPDAGY